MGASDQPRGKPGNAGQFAEKNVGRTQVPTPASMPRPAGTSSPLPDQGVMVAAQHAAMKEKEAAAVRQAAAVTQSVTPGTMQRPASKPSGQSVMTPGGWELSRHLVKQALEKGLDFDDVVAAVDSPQTTYESGRYPGQMKHIRNGVCVAVDPQSRKAITVFVDRVETDLRADQRGDADAVAWDRKRRR